LVLILGSVSISYSADICFPESDVKKMVVELEKGRITSQELLLQVDKNLELQNQIKIVTEKYNVCDETSKKQDKALKDYDELIKAKDKACDEKVDAAKPGFWKTIGSAMLVLLGGIIIGLLI